MALLGVLWASAKQSAKPAPKWTLQRGNWAQVIVQSQAPLELGSLLGALGVLSLLTHVSLLETFYHVAFSKGKKLGDYTSFFPR